MSTRIINARRNIISGFANKLLSILMDNLFVSILQVLNLSELGLSSAIVYCMYAPIAENNVKVVNAYYGFIKKAYQIIGVLVLFLGVLIIPILPHLIRGNVPSDINLYILFFVYLFNAVISYFLFAYKNVMLSASQRVDIYNNIMSISRLAMYALQIIVLFSFSNYYVYIIMLLHQNMLTIILRNIAHAEN